MGLLDFVSSGPGLAVGDLTVESAILPPIVVALPLAGGGGGGGEGRPLWLRVLRPRFTVETIAGPVTIEPAGSPPAFPWVGLAAAVGAVAVLWLAAYGRPGWRVGDAVNLW